MGRTWVQPHVAQPVLCCAQNTVRQLRGLQQGKVHNARLKAHTQFVQQAFGAAGQSVDSLRPAVIRFQECLPRLWRNPWDKSGGGLKTTGAKPATALLGRINKRRSLTQGTSALRGILLQ
jgi:hypothetical protein